MLAIDGTARWRKTHLGAIIGLLEISGVDNTVPAPALKEEKRAVEAELRIRYEGFTRKDFRALPVIAAYREYYKRFKKTYHVLQQVESVAIKGRNLPNVSPLVDANFAAELDTLVLTAGHDVDKLQGKIYIDIAGESDEMTRMNGAVKKLYPGDMVMKDDSGVVCSIIYGQDNVSFITKKTSHVLYVVYAPGGVPEALVEKQLKKIESNIYLFSTDADVEQFALLKT